MRFVECDGYVEAARANIDEGMFDTAKDKCDDYPWVIFFLISTNLIIIN